jgi:hypothetical protein
MFIATNKSGNRKGEFNFQNETIKFDISLLFLENLMVQKEILKLLLPRNISVTNFLHEKNIY